jgi:hypothetical protein
MRPRVFDFLHKSSRLQVVPEYGIANISNDATCRFNIHGIRQMGVKYTFLFVILPVNLQKVRTKIVDNRIVVVGSIAV